jgi:hypothetical protein
MQSDAAVPPPAPPLNVRWRCAKCPRDVYSAPGSSTLSPESMATIQQVVANYKTTAMPP